MRIKNSNCAVVATLAFAMCSQHACGQAEARLYTDVYEKIGVAGGYSLKRTRFELTAGFRIDHIPAEDYLEQAHPWTSQQVAVAAMQSFSDNTWQENTTILTARVLRWGKKEHEWFKLYWGLYMRCLIRGSTPDSEGWSSTDISFMNNNRMPVSKKYVSVFGGLLLGARGKIAKGFFWDVSAGLKLIPWFYHYSNLEYNDGTSDKESYQMAGYQYSAPGDNVLQVGIGYKF